MKKMSCETGQGEAGEVHYIKAHTSMIESRLESIETLLEKSITSSDK